ncbi:MAG TPA: radical SAM protein [Desulfobacteria bacterium]|nr:radical SAM protein [Desulfobacteria bacterium]
MIKCSAGTAKLLGLTKIKTDALPTTAYLMTGKRCRSDCSFCPQAQNSSSRADLLARVTWPEYAVDPVIARVAALYAAKRLQRACFQVISSPDALQETKQLLHALQALSPVPVCISCAVGTLGQVAELLEQGADHVSIALDAACERIFTEHKGGSWDKRYTLLTEAAKRFPGRIATHLIVGLGETEEEMLKTVQQMADHRIIIALFAFTPVKGTRLEGRQPPELGHYRRVQAAKFLIVHGLDHVERMAFVGGRLTAFGIERAQWVEALATGEAFRTSGCTGCNRPYYNEQPGGLMFNYPRALTREECERALNELHLGS